MLVRAWSLVATAIPCAAQEVIFHIEGQAFNELLSTSAYLGDLDQDGVPDVLVATVNHSTLRVYSGRTHAQILEIVGEQGINLGFSLGGAGDFDGDGTIDIVAGAPSEYAGGIMWSGSARVYSGADGHEVARWNGVVHTGRMGMWVAELGDITGDGYTDVGVAAFVPPRVWILGGPDMHLIRTHDGVHTSPSVAGVGDVDGDGLPDYICGWPQDSTTGLWAGKATVFSGRNGAPIFTVYGQTGHGGGLTGDHLGRAVAGVGDVNGDGIPDFAAGAPGEIDLTFAANHGMVRVYSGADASTLWEWQAVDHTVAPSTQIGHRLDSGDVNGDGFSDVLVTVPFDSYHLQTRTGSFLVFSGRTGELLWRTFDTTPGITALTLRWHSVVGDINEDGLADIAMGNPDWRTTTNNGLGRITLFAGARGDVDRVCQGAPNSVGPGARLDTQYSIGLRNARLRLVATGAVPGQVAHYLYGRPQAPLPFGDGSLCARPPHFRASPPLVVEQDGSLRHWLAFDAPPIAYGPGQILPGVAHVFQLHYRDPQGPLGSGFNLSDALRIRFLP